MDYFKFVIDPDGFGNTVENMFHISFLVKDGRVSFCVMDVKWIIEIHVGRWRLK